MLKEGPREGGGVWEPVCVWCAGCVVSDVALHARGCTWSPKLRGEEGAFVSPAPMCPWKPASSPCVRPWVLQGWGASGVRAPRG